MADLSQAFVPISSVLDDIWMFNTQSPHFQIERKLMIFLYALLIWNYVSFSLEVCMFLVLSGLLLVSWMTFKYTRLLNRGASDEHISKLRKWRYKKAQDCNSVPTNQVECCICLVKYRKNEEMMQLPCSHMFHQVCVEKWLKIRSICPLCKQGLQSKIN